MLRSTVPIFNLFINGVVFFPIGKNVKQRLITNSKPEGLVENEDYVKAKIKTYKNIPYMLLGYEMNYRTDFPFFALIIKKLYEMEDLSKCSMKISKRDLLSWFEFQCLNKNNKASLYKSFMRIMDLKIVFYDIGDENPTIKSLITGGKFDNNNNFIIEFSKSIKMILAKNNFIENDNLFSIAEQKFISKNNNVYQDKTFINFDKFFKIKNETAMCLYCFLLSHDLKKPFSFKRIKSLINVREQTNSYTKKKIVDALSHLEKLELIKNYEISEDIKNSAWLTFKSAETIESNSLDFEIPDGIELGDDLNDSDFFEEVFND